jgi:guanylate cyclase soluble subunit beta
MCPQCGAVLHRMYPTLVPGSHLRDSFKLKHPYVALDYELIAKEQLNNSFLLKSNANGLELKGQMILTQMQHAPGCPAMKDVMLFMG